jgi:hypothetical protein
MKQFASELDVPVAGVLQTEIVPPGILTRLGGAFQRLFATFTGAPNRYCAHCMELGQECPDCFELWQLGA